MKKQIIVSGLIIAAAVSAGLAAIPAIQDPPAGMEPPHEMPPPPGEHHEWLNQLVGEWAVDTEMMMGPPGTEPTKCTGTDTVRSLGGRWVVSEMESQIPGMGAMSALFSIGYNTETGKYQSTWISSVDDYIWISEGTLDATGKILTLETEGPDMMNPGQTTKYRDVIEIKSPDHRTLTSSAMFEGQWVQFATANFHRK